jgi:hypothetical protein
MPKMNHESMFFLAKFSQLLTTIFKMAKILKFGFLLFSRQISIFLLNHKIFMLGSTI